MVLYRKLVSATATLNIQPSICLVSVTYTKTSLRSQEKYNEHLVQGDHGYPPVSVRLPRYNKAMKLRQI